jgi:hypothetical protein
VHLEDAFAALHVRPVDDDLAVEAARTQQRGIEHVGTVRRGDEDDALVRVEAVHLDEQLIERLLALVVTATEPGAAMAADSVDLVDEDDRRSVALALIEEIAHATRPDTHEHLDEVRARHREERHARLAGDRLREQRLARARGTEQQRALRDASAEALELLRVLQELDDLLQLLLRLVGARHVLERDARILIERELRARLAELQRGRAARLHLAHDEEPRTDEDEDREVADDLHPPVGLRRADVDLDAGVLLPHHLGHALAVARDVGLELLERHGASRDDERGRRLQRARHFLVDDVEPLDVRALDLLDESRVRDVGALRPLPEVEVRDQERDDDDERPQRDRAAGTTRRNRHRSAAPRHAGTRDARVRRIGLLVVVVGAVLVAEPVHVEDSVGASGTTTPT